MADTKYVNLADGGSGGTGSDTDPLKVGDLETKLETASSLTDDTTYLCKGTSGNLPEITCANQSHDITFKQWPGETEAIFTSKNTNAFRMNATLQNITFDGIKYSLGQNGGFVQLEEGTFQTVKFQNCGLVQNNADAGSFTQGIAAASGITVSGTIEIDSCLFRGFSESPTLKATRMLNFTIGSAITVNVRNCLFDSLKDAMFFSGSNPTYNLINCGFYNNLNNFVTAGGASVNESSSKNALASFLTDYTLYNIQIKEDSEALLAGSTSLAVDYFGNSRPPGRIDIGPHQRSIALPGGPGAGNGSMFTGLALKI